MACLFTFATVSFEEQKIFILMKSKVRFSFIILHDLWLYKVFKIYIRCIRRQWHPTPVLLPGKSHGRRSLVGYSPWGRWESDTTERLHFHFSLSCFGEGDGNPTQCSCLENPRDRGARWASVYGVAQSRTWLKRLSSSSSEGWDGWMASLIQWTWVWTNSRK